MIKKCAHPIREILGRTKNRDSTGWLMREYYTIKCMTCDYEYEESETGLVKDLQIALANEEENA